MTSLRDQTASALSRFLSRHKLDNPWSDRPGSSTRLLFSEAELYVPDRLDLHDELIASRFADDPGRPSDGTLAVVVTAGPPGAGKSTAVARYPELARFRDVDSDSFKDDLLRQSQSDGLLDAWLSEVLPDGRPIALRELATFVHAESTIIANAFRAAAFERGENLLIHGTLADPQTVDDLLGVFDGAGYERLLILDVEVPKDVAIERALSRWWEVREQGGDPLGGRFVPPSAIELYYPQGSATSVTRANADEFVQRARDLEWDVTLERIEDSASPSTILSPR